jgi:hypothetical protein
MSKKKASKVEQPLPSRMKKPLIKSPKIIKDTDGAKVTLMRLSSAAKRGLSTNGRSIPTTDAPNDQLAKALYQGYLDGMEDGGHACEESWSDLDDTVRGAWRKVAQVARWEVLK